MSVGKVSVEPFLRWVAEDAEHEDSEPAFLLAEAPTIMVGLKLAERAARNSVVRDVPPHETPKMATPPAVERCTTSKGTPMKLPDVVQAAAQSKLRTEMQPISDKLTRLRATLDAYEVRVEQDAERRVSNALLAALGEPQAPEDPTFEVARKELHDAIVQVLALVATAAGQPPPTPQRTEPEPPPVAPPAPPIVAHAPEQVRLEPPPSKPPTQPVSRPPARLLKQTDIAAAKRLIAEIESLRAEKKDHPTRLSPLLQALVAEVRLLLDKLPEDNYLHERLSSLIPVLGAIKEEGGVKEYIKGLARDAHGDWERISHRSRQRVAQFDADAAASERQPESRAESKPPKKPTGPPEPASNGHHWPELPRLRCLTKPILLAGGILIPEKLTNVKERFGLDIEWHEIDHDNPRASQALMSRVRAGKVGALILLEGVMRHSTYKPVVEACNNMHVPYAMGDKAGIASLQSAFDDLERKLKGTP